FFISSFFIFSALESSTGIKESLSRFVISDVTKFETSREKDSLLLSENERMGLSKVEFIEESEVWLKEEELKVGSKEEGLEREGLEVGSKGEEFVLERKS